MNKQALIIGGTGGIGSAIVSRLLALGYMVYATYANSQEIHERENCKYIRCDLRNPNEIKDLMDYFEVNAISIDLVVNCASGKMNLKLFKDLSAEEIRDDMEIVLTGAVGIYQGIVPSMMARKSGMIVNLITSSVFEPVPARMSSYVMAKSALLGLTNALAVELKNSGIKVFGISPYFVETELIKAFPAKLLEMEREQMPDKKFLCPDDIADVLEMLLENETETGANLIVHSRADVDDLLSK